MARKRERWLNMAWLHWLEGDTGEGTAAQLYPDGQTVGHYMPTLCGVYKRFIETEKDGNTYRLRVLPRNPEQEHGGMALGLSYSGTNLNSLFQHAVSDLDCLNTGAYAYRAGRTEWPRWVA